MGNTTVLRMAKARDKARVTGDSTSAAQYARMVSQWENQRDGYTAALADMSPLDLVTFDVLTLWAPRHQGR